MSGELGFLDTNVLVYAFERRPSEKQQVAKRLLAELMEEDRLRVSTQVLQELFVTLTRKVVPRCSIEEALSFLEELTEWPLLSVDYSVIRAAAVLAGEARISFWDALIVVAAARSRAKVLYTEDLNHGQEILGVRVSNPFAG
jgi:predicted nucleic acid-binding protein